MKMVNPEVCGKWLKTLDLNEGIQRASIEFAANEMATLVVRRILTQEDIAKFAFACMNDTAISPVMTIEEKDKIRAVWEMRYK